MRGASTSSRASSSPPPATPRQSSSAASACAESPFAISAAALEKLVSSRDLDALHERGGVTGLAKGLRSDLSRGLHDDGGEVFEARRRLYGTNRLPDRKTRGIFQLMLAALNDKVLILLSVVAVVSLALGLYQSVALPHGPDRPRVEWVDGVTIMAAVVIVVVAGALNDYQKERQFARLNKKVQDDGQVRSVRLADTRHVKGRSADRADQKEDRKVRVIRSGETRQVSVFDILVGDILKLEPGDLVPADAILVTGHGGVRADESSMTGESEQVPKQPADEALANKSCGSEQLDPFIVSGSKIVSGVGDCLVTAVGPNSTYGRLKLSIGERTEAATPLQVKLSAVADKVAFAGAAVAVLLFVVLSVKFFAQLPRNSDPPSEKAQAFLRIFMVSITIVVIAVPEGLPLAVTLALAIAVSRMLRDNNLVRILSACETMANATSVCSDKTGTLTTNKMSVTTGIVGPDGRFSLPDNEDNNKSGAPNHGQPSSDPSSQSAARDAAIGTDDSVDDTVASLPQDVRHLLLESIAVNSAAFEGEDEGQPAYIGSRTEAAILDFAKRHLNMGPLRSARPAADQVADLFPFSSERKFMATVVKKGDKYRMFVKGAPEILLERSQRILQDASSSPFQTVEVSETHEKTLQGVIQEYSGRSLRTLGFAYRDFDEWPLRSMGHDHDGEDKAVVHGASDTIFFHLVFLGIFGLRDPPRPGVRDAVALCQRAGVRVRMVTGDNVDTAKAIAREVGILTDEGIAMEGRQFRELPRERLAKVLARLQVLARASPEDKKALVRMLKQQGEIVAATGDGTNDGPALRAADVGFSMGMAGTEVAREASSIVLMDDNFASIVKAIQWGRSVNDVIRRFLHVSRAAVRAKPPPSQLCDVR